MAQDSLLADHLVSKSSEPSWPKMSLGLSIDDSKRSSGLFRVHLRSNQMIWLQTGTEV